MAIGMAPAKQELADGIPFVGPSGRIFNEALAASKYSRSQVYVTNLCSFYIDDNDLYSVPEEIMDAEKQRVFDEVERVRPNVLLILGGDTLDILTATHLDTYIPKSGKRAGRKTLTTIGAKQGIQKWRGSIITLDLPSGRKQKCVVAMHPAAFVRGQWKWLPIFKYIDVPKAVMQSSFAEMKLTVRSAIVSPSFSQATEWLQEMRLQEWVSIDYEGRKHLTCLGSGSTISEAMCIPLSRVGSPIYYTLAEESKIWKLWCALLEDPKVKLIAQNAGFEWLKSWLYGIYPTPLGIDPMSAHHCLYPDFGGVVDEWSARKRDIDNPGHGLAFLVSQYTDMAYYKDDGRHWIPAYGERAFWEYNCLDVMGAFEVAMKERIELEKAGLWETYERSYIDTFEPSMRMEWIGVSIDTLRRDEARIEILAELKTMGEGLEEAIGMPVVTKAIKGDKRKVLNLASPKQMQEFLYKTLGYKAQLKHKTGKITTDKDAIYALIAKHGNPALKTIMDMKQKQDFLNDVVNQPLDTFNRIHCHHKLGGTNGTRWSTTESILGNGTNLQNLPRQGPGRSFFLPS